MGFLTKEQILEAQDITTEVVPVPEWGGDVMVRGLSGLERDAFEATIISQNGMQRRRVQMNLTNFRAKLVARCVVDPDTQQRMFSDEEAARLGKKSAAALQRVFNVAQRLSGLSEEDIEELTKNFESEPNGASGSA